ncbi:hypothetical protein [Mycolicibacterium gadium]|jgi:hypothetical protein|uniref:hypothetical protein n=1 Tax=Mycolicibacterium gadium TaxID=1794 RepID=UPI002FDE041C
MSEGEMNGDVIDRDAVLRAAVEEHRRQLEALSAGMARVEQIDADMERLQAQRVEAVREVEQLHADLTSGRSAGEAIAALGLNGLSVGGRGAKPARRAAKRSAARVGSRKKSSEPTGDRAAVSAESPAAAEAGTQPAVAGVGA